MRGSHRTRQKATAGGPIFRILCGHLSQQNEARQRSQEHHLEKHHVSFQPLIWVPTRPPSLFEIPYLSANRMPPYHCITGITRGLILKASGGSPWLSLLASGSHQVCSAESGVESLGTQRPSVVPGTVIFGRRDLWRLSFPHH